MSINRKWAFARAVVYDEDSRVWIAEARAGSGTWLMWDVNGDDTGYPGQIPLRGLWVDFTNEDRGPLTLPVEQRDELGLGNDAYTELNDALRESQREQDSRSRRQRCQECDQWSCSDAHTVLRYLGLRLSPQGILEGVEISHAGLRFRREGDAWVAVGTTADALDEVARTRAGADLPATEVV